MVYFETSVTYPKILYSSNICEILLYNRQLVVITHELIYGFRAAHHWRKIVVKQIYLVTCIFMLSTVFIVNHIAVCVVVLAAFGIPNAVFHAEGAIRIACIMAADTII